MSELQRLHFSLGPVQVFVAQSRRTRDLWSSSFILSYLAGRAIGAVLDLEPSHRVELPEVDENALWPFRADGAPSAIDPHVSFPNRFIARVRDPVEAGEAAERAVRESWRRIADAVWKRFVAPFERRGNGTGTIWHRQVENLWEITWITGEDLRLLDRIKYWRAHPAAVEPGIHCSLMGDYQELSGYLRTRGERRKSDNFWEALRGRASDLDLRPNERLCAIALIKRLFPRVSQTAIGCSLDDDVVRWPSTVYIAAVPWIEEACKHAAPDAASYARFIAQADVRQAFGESSAGAAAMQRYRAAGRFPALGGNFLFTNMLAHETSTPLPAAEDGLRGRLVAALQQLTSSVKARVAIEPSPFFSLILMDGDRMGALLRAAEAVGCMTAVTRALSRFAQNARDIVSRYQGVTVYAGGDDLLALAPVPSALEIASAVRREYTASFLAEELPTELSSGATISGAVLFAHCRVALRTLLHSSHRLLDETAKAQTGRDAVVVGLRLSGGMNALWSSPWDAPGMDAIPPIIQDLRAGRIGSSGLVRVGSRLSRLASEHRHEPGALLQLDDQLDLEALIVAELVATRECPLSGDGDEDGRDTAGRIARDLLHLTTRARRAGEPATIVTTRGLLNWDGVAIARFLSEGRLADGERQ